MSRVPALVVCACVTLAASLHAQVADSSAVSFRPGQWGVQAVVASGISEAGALRFATPRRAWVLDGSFDGNRQTTSGSSTSPDQTSLLLGASLGERWYHGAARLFGFTGAGLTGGYSYDHADGVSGGYHGWMAGAYGEAGVIYIFTPRFGLGSRSVFALTRAENVQTSNNPFQGSTTVRLVDYHMALRPVEVLATIYF